MSKIPHQSTLDSEGHPLEKVDWNFKSADTRQATHGLHRYPARMVPQIAEHLLNYYQQTGAIEEGDLIYDPFCGSGTTAVEARLHGFSVKANDINPFAVMLARAKTTALDMEILESAKTELLEDLELQLESVRNEYEKNGKASVELPDVRDGWFPEPELQQLAVIRDEIDSLLSKYGADIIRFLKIALARTTREVSYQRNSEFKRYRMSESDRKEHNPDVYDDFSQELKENIEKMKDLTRRISENTTSQIEVADSRSISDSDLFADGDKADMIITSPPYGDHQTTVAYGEFSTDPAIISDDREFKEMASVDKDALGGSRSCETIESLETKSSALSHTVDILEEKNGRSDDALSFFSDYYEVMKEVNKVIQSGQPVAWVVANRTMSSVPIPTHKITQELCEEIGYNTEVVLSRGILNKTLPYKNSPSGETGEKGEMMSKENIVVMRAP